jgi:hypothetical protein
MNQIRLQTGGESVPTFDRCEPGAAARTDRHPSRLSRSRHRRFAFASSPLLLALIGLAGTAGAQTSFPITFDARTLAAPFFNVNFGTIGAIWATAQLQTFSFPPGAYTFHAPPSSPLLVAFTVTATGTVDVDPPVSYASGSGSTLTVTGLPLTVDATTLSTHGWGLGGDAGHGSTSAISTVNLLPGLHSFQLPAGNSTSQFTFALGSDGSIGSDPVLPVYATGTGTSTLTVAGFPLTVDATALSANGWGLSGGEVGRPTAAISTVRLLPGPWRFELPAGHPGMTFVFTLGNDGTLDFDSSHDAYVSGRGTATLTVAGLPLTIDATALSHSAFNILAGEAGGGQSSQVTTLRLLPTTNGFPLSFHSPPSTGNSFAFTFSTSGTVDFAASLDLYVSGRGTGTLTISGFPITIDATAVPVADFNISFDAGGPNQVTTFRQIPGLYDLRLPASSSNVVFYTVDGLGHLDYDTALDFCVQGRGTNVLTVLCDPASTPDPLQLIADLKTYINGLAASSLKNSNGKLASALVNKLNAVLSQVDAALDETNPAVQDQLLQDALDKIRNDILAKTDGCGAAGAPDSNDWIVDCAVQAEVSLRLNRILAAITTLI